MLAAEGRHVIVYTLSVNKDKKNRIDIFLLILIVANLANLATGLFTYSKNTRSDTNRLFAILTLSLIGWTTANYFSVSLTAPEDIFQSVKVIFTCVAIQNLAFFLLMCTFPRNRIPMDSRNLALLTGFTAVVALLPHANLIFSGYSQQGGTIALIPTFGIGLFILHVGITVFGGLWQLTKRFRRSRGLLRNQFSFLIFASIVLWGVVPLTNFVLPLTLDISLFAALSPAYALLFGVIIAYAIVRQRLFDIRPVVARSAAYLLLLVTLAGLYGAAVFGATSLLFHGDESSAAQQAVNIALAIVLAFTFQPLRRFFEHLTDRLFYRDRYDSQEVLRRIGKILAYEIRLEELLRQSLETVCAQMRLAGGRFVVLEKGRVYQQIGLGDLATTTVTNRDGTSLGHHLISVDELSGGARRRTLDRLGARISLPMHYKGEIVGYLLLGEKRSGDIYSPQDVDLLKLLANELAVGVTNARAYEEIARFAETLQIKVDEATKRLRAANRKLKELDHAKDEFISMAAHQLRTPLTVIKGYLSMLDEGDAGPVPKKQREFIDPAYSAARGMVRLIADLLNVSRMTSGKFVLERTPTDLGALARQETTNLIETAKTKGLKLEYHPPRPKVPTIAVDENKLQQVMMNFIDNAIYYTEDGKIDVTLAKVRDRVEFTVTDTGIGVPPAAQKKLFSKFFRADNAKTQRPEGTGLGLYMAKRVVEDHGGTLIFHSEPGHGSTFGFSLPIKPA